jgi:hypothetical protein
MVTSGPMIENIHLQRFAKTYLLFHECHQLFLVLRVQAFNELDIIFRYNCGVIGRKFKKQIHGDCLKARHVKSELIEASK